MPATPSQNSKDDFHRERSRFLDAFAVLEETLAERPLPAADQAASDLLKTLRAIRNDVVHSQLRFANLDGELHAILINSQEARKAARQSRVIALGDFQKLGSQIGNLKKALG